MNLSPEDAALFFRLRTSLLAYASVHLNLIVGVRRADDVMGLPPPELLRIREALVARPDLLKSYVAENPDRLSSEELGIISSWQHWVRGRFYVVRFLRAYAVFLSSEDEPHLYGVLSLYDRLEDQLGRQPLPAMVDALLLPFRGQIIYDGLLNTYALYFGPGIRGSLNDSYNALKEREGIIEQLAAASGEREIRTSLARRKPRKPAPDLHAAVNEIAARTDSMRRADTKLQEAALSTLRSAAGLAQVVFAQPADDEECTRRLRQTRAALAKLEGLLWRV